MESFFEFIFANFFIVIIIVAAIINFFNKGQKSEREQRTDQRQPQRTSPPVNRRESAPVEQPTPMTRSERETVANTIEEQRQEQYERLQKQYMLSEQSEADEVSFNDHRSQKTHNELTKKNQDTINLERKLSPEGLIESVIMAEVLGPPRALNRYRNIAAKRNER